MRTPNTFLLYWNPYFSSYKLERFLNDFPFTDGKDVLTDADDWDRSPDMFNWSIAEYDKAHAGDRFVFIKVGYDRPTGIVGVGQFTSEPYCGEDWSGQGRKIYYMDMDWEAVVNPTSDLVLKTHELIKAIPEVMWSKGRAGVMVAPEIAEKIDALWKRHIETINKPLEHTPVTPESTLGFAVDAEIVQEFLHGKRSTYSISIDEDCCNLLLENVDGNLLLNTDELPNEYHGCYFYNNGSFPYLIKSSLKHILLDANGKRIIGRIVGKEITAGKRFRSGKNQYDVSVEDPNGDNCVWTITFKLAPAR